MKTRYRRKPLEVEAIQYTGSEFSLHQIRHFARESVSVDRGRLYIRTLNGFVRVNVGDYVIRGVKDEFYPCDPEVFFQTYETVE